MGEVAVEAAGIPATGFTQCVCTERRDGFVLAHIYQNCIHFQAIHSLGIEPITLSSHALPAEIQ